MPSSQKTNPNTLWFDELREWVDERENSFEVIRKAEARGGLNTEDKYGQFPLHVAVYFQRPKIINALIDAGANIEAKDVHGYTPLHYAAFWGKRESIKALLLRGADKNAEANEGIMSGTPREVTQHNKQVDQEGKEELLEMFDEVLAEVELMKPPEPKEEMQADADMDEEAVYEEVCRILPLECDDFYATLDLGDGCEPNVAKSTLDQIKSAHKRLCHLLNPKSEKNDGVAGIEEAFKLVNQAYDTLTDSSRRKEHDLAIAKAIANRH